MFNSALIYELAVLKKYSGAAPESCKLKVSPNSAKVTVCLSFFSYFKND